MGVVALGSVRSCGVTTLAVALAATWPVEHAVLLMELDPAGGTLAAASAWPPEPSLVSLAAAARRGGDPDLVWEHCHNLPGGAAVLSGPASAEQTSTALGMLGPLLARLRELDSAVLVDCGRLGTDPATAGVLGEADRLVLAVRPRVADLHALATWLESHPLDRVLQLVTVGDGPYRDGEIAEALGVEVLARLPWDPDGAEALLTVPASARDLRMAPLVRAARTLADQLATNPAARSDPGQGSLGPAGWRSPLAVSRRLLRVWRAEAPVASTNGSAPEGSAR